MVEVCEVGTVATVGVFEKSLEWPKKYNTSCARKCFPKIDGIDSDINFFKVVTFSRKLLKVNFSKKPIQCLNKQIEIKMLN